MSLIVKLCLLHKQNHTGKLQCTCKTTIKRSYVRQIYNKESRKLQSYELFKNYILYY